MFFILALFIILLTCLNQIKEYFDPYTECSEIPEYRCDTCSPVKIGDCPTQKECKECQKCELDECQTCGCPEIECGKCPECPNCDVIDKSAVMERILMDTTVWHRFDNRSSYPKSGGGDLTKGRVIKGFANCIHTCAKDPKCKWFNYGTVDFPDPDWKQRCDLYSGNNTNSNFGLRMTDQKNVIVMAKGDKCPPGFTLEKGKPTCCAVGSGCNNRDEEPDRCAIENLMKSADMPDDSRNYLGPYGIKIPIKYKHHGVEKTRDMIDNLPMCGDTSVDRLSIDLWKSKPRKDTVQDPYGFFM